MPVLPAFAPAGPAAPAECMLLQPVPSSTRAAAAVAAAAAGQDRKPLRVVPPAVVAGCAQETGKVAKSVDKDVDMVWNPTVKKKGACAPETLHCGGVPKGRPKGLAPGLPASHPLPHCRNDTDAGFLARRARPHRKRWAGHCVGQRRLSPVPASKSPGERPGAPAWGAGAAKRRFRPFSPSALQPFFCSILMTLEKSSPPWPAMLCAANRLRARPPRGVLAFTAVAFSCARPRSLSIRSVPKPPM